MIKLLSARGKALYRKKPGELLNSDIDIKEYMEKNSELITIPKEAIITFRNEESLQRAIKLNMFK